MFDFLRRRRERLDSEFAAQNEEYAIHKGQLLDACSNDLERRSLCLQWAGQTRNEWFEGQRAAVIGVLRSRDLRYRDYGTDVRISIGQQKWSRSVQAKELADQEKMYSRWARQYTGGPGSER